MINLLVHFKNSLYGLVSIIWGLFFVLSVHVSNEITFYLLFLSFSPHTLGLICIGIGAIHIFSRFFGDTLFAAFANILLASVYLVVLLSHLYASFYALAWIAFVAIVLNQIINAYLIIKSK